MIFKFYYIPYYAPFNRPWWVLLKHEIDVKYRAIKGSNTLTPTPYKPTENSMFSKYYPNSIILDFEAASLDEAIAYIFPYIL